MFAWAPSLDPDRSEAALDRLLIRRLEPSRFSADLTRLQQLFRTYAAGCPPPWASPGLVVSAELHCQSEVWLPLDAIRPAFAHLYRSALRYPPILSSTPFAGALSWAGLVAAMPPQMDWCVDPARLLERLVHDVDLRTRFLCWSFMPRRFYGSAADRYPGQSAFLAEWAGQLPDSGTLACLDAACGDGAGTYRLAQLLGERGRGRRLTVEGWTLEPLEVWAAAHGRFPHDPDREGAFRRLMEPVLALGEACSLTFRQADMARPQPRAGAFDVILCNGLLGGPIVHRPEGMALMVRHLAVLLKPGGLLVAANCFHQGWQKKCPQDRLRALLESCGLVSQAAGEGVAGLRPG